MCPQGGTTEGDGLLEDNIYAAAAGEAGSVVLAGSTNGQWGGPNAGGSDFAAVKLNAAGVEIGRWQVRLSIRLPQLEILQTDAFKRCV